MTDKRPQAPRSLPGRGVRVLTIHQVPVYVSPFSLIFAVLVGVSFDSFARSRLFGPFAASDSRSYGLGALIAVVTMLSIVLHELGHAFVAQGFGFNVNAVTIYGFVGITEFSPEPQTPFRSFAVSVSGPLVNVAIGVPAWIWYGSLDPHSSLGVFVFGLAFTNVILGLANLLPGLPLDGGAALASGVWKLTGDRNRATVVAAYAGFVVAGGVGVYGLRQLQNGNSAYTLFIAVFMALGAGSALKRSRVVEILPGIAAGAVARKAITVEANLPLSEALRRAQAQGVIAVIVADSSGRPWAVMNGAAADAVPADRRPWTSINEVSRPIEDGMRIPESLSGQALMERLTANPASEYVVYGEDGRLTGVLVMVDFVARIDPAAAARLAPRR